MSVKLVQILTSARTVATKECIAVNVFNEIT